MTTNVPYFNPFDFPNITKDTIGFDKVLLRLREAINNVQRGVTYPPYNIRKLSDDKYVIELAVAGFGKQDIELTLQEGVLTVKGNVSSDTVEEDFIFKGIAARAFTRQFVLADQVQIKNADMINGMLKIWLDILTPEASKAKTIKIN